MTPPGTGGDDSIDVRRAFRALRSRWWVVVLSVVVGGALLYGISQVLPTSYQATATLVYEPADLAGVVDADIFPDESQHNIQSDALAIETRAVADRVAAGHQLGLSSENLRESVSAEAVPELSLVRVTAKRSDAETAAATANAFAGEYVLLRQERAKEIISHARDVLGQRISQLTPTEAGTEYGLQLQQRYDELGVQLETQQGDFAVLDLAAAVDAAESPRPWLWGGIGTILGFIVGIGLVVLLEALDIRLNDEAAVAREYGLPVLATMPRLPRGRRRRAAGQNPGVGFGEGKEALLESSRLLRSTLKLKGFGSTSKTLLITSAVPKEGKTSTAVNLALAMALSGDRVVLIDGDLRMPKVHEYLSLPNDKGLQDVLLHSAQWRDVAQPVNMGRFAPAMMRPVLSQDADTMASNLYCVTSGPLQTGAAEILDSPRLRALLEDLKRVADYVILDGPPLLTVSDSLSVIKWVDSVVLMAKLGATTPKEAGQLRNLLATAGANVLGAVVVGGNPRTDDHYYYYYHHRAPNEPFWPGADKELGARPRAKADQGWPGCEGNGRGRAGNALPAPEQTPPPGPTVAGFTRLAFIADVNGNAAALQAILDDLDRRGIRSIYCLGDLVGYGAYPNEVIEAIRERGIPTLLGDDDEAAAFGRGPGGFSTAEARRIGKLAYDFTVRTVTEHNKEWLRGLPQERELRVEGLDLHLVHGSLGRIDEHLLPDGDEGAFREIAADEAADILLFGHTNSPWHRSVAGVLFVSVGSAGRPKDGDPRAIYTLLRLSLSEEPRVEAVRVPYDVEGAAQGVVSAGLPPGLADSIRQGR